MNTANRKYKDSVFVDLFSEDEKAKENFLSLYNALHGTNLQLSCPVENIRLDNVMYMNIINDVSCLVDNKIIVLAEHQSTINENMPSQGMYFRVHSLTSSFELCSKHRKAKPTAILGGTEMTFANRRSRCKELGKKVPQAYRVYVEDTFLSCDAADARIFAKEEVINSVTSRI